MMTKNMLRRAIRTAFAAEISNCSFILRQDPYRWENPPNPPFPPSMPKIKVTEVAESGHVHGGNGGNGGFLHLQDAPTREFITQRVAVL